MEEMKVVVAILSGGAGSRLWPVSREMHPKPFLHLLDGQSLIQKAWLRGAILPHVAEILTVTNRELFFKTESEYRAVANLVTKKVTNSFILEPFGRNTAPAVAAAALYTAKKFDDNTILLVLAADHLITNQQAFATAVNEAAQLALQNKLVTFGIQPSSPETGYGYIEVEGSHVIRFIEKPSLNKAEEFLAAGRYLWNSGMFCFTAGTVLRELNEHCPAILHSVSDNFEKAVKIEGEDFLQIEFKADTFQCVPEDSIDYALMEKTKNVAVVSCDIGWNDIGSWNAIVGMEANDERGNSVSGEAMLHDVSNCHIQSNQRMVGAVGVNNLIIIDTPDALLVSDRNRVQDVKHLYTNLKAKGHQTYKLHRTVHRPWGTYTILEEGDGFKIKRIVVKPGASLSLQMHKHRSEHWVVVQGVATVTNGDKEFLVNVNESTYIPVGNQHRLCNAGSEDLIIIEVQSGKYLGEDDIVRFQDNYGRV